MNETETLAEFNTSTSYDDIPREAVDQAKRAIRDIAGLTIHGSHHGTGQTVMEYLSTLETGEPATVVGHGSANPPRAAFANGTFGHILNFDDTFESVVIHPTCTAFPAALAAAETVDGSGPDLLCGYIVGLDVTYRVGRSVAPTHWHHGWHSTATIGVFGATAASASIFDLSRAQTRRAFGIAGSFSSGLKKNIGTMTNPLHCGHAAQKGVEAAMLARNGADADPAIFEGEYGFGRVMTVGDSYDPSPIERSGIDWAVLDIAFKPYPSGVVTHSAMEALREILERESLPPGDVAGVTATVDERVMDTIDEHDPKDAAAANVSYEFCLAVILLEGDAGVHEFTDEYVQRATIREAMGKIHLDPRPDPFGSRGAEASYGARITVETVDGQTFTEEIRTAPGGPSNPVSEQRWREKFFECTDTVFERADAERIEDRILHLEEADTLSELGQLLRAE